MSRSCIPSELPPITTHRTRSRKRHHVHHQKSAGHRLGDESKLRIVEVDLPDPSPGEVQLVVDYSVISGSDVNMRRGTYPFQKKPPLTPGYTVLGRVLRNGKGTSAVELGEQIVCLSKYEGQAQPINLPASPGQHPLAI